MVSPSDAVIWLMVSAHIFQSMIIKEPFKPSAFPIPALADQASFAPRIDIAFGADGLLGDFARKPARWRRVIEMTACLAYHFGENGMAFLFRRAFGRDRFSGFEATLEDADFLKLQRNTAFS